MRKRVKPGETRELGCKKFRDEESGLIDIEFLQEVDASEESKVPANQSYRRREFLTPSEIGERSRKRERRERLTFGTGKFF